MHLRPWYPQQGPALGQNVGSETEQLYKSCWRSERGQRRGGMAGGSLQIQLHNICKHILWWHSPQWKMGSECSTLWHKVNYRNNFTPYSSLNKTFQIFSTAYVWIGMISRSNPSRDGVVIRAQRHNLFTFFFKIWNKLYVFPGESTTPHIIMAVHPTMTFSSLSFWPQWTWQTLNCHMCSQRVGPPLNLQVDG